MKVFGDLHSSLSFAQEMLYRPSPAKMPLGQVLRGHCHARASAWLSATSKTTLLGTKNWLFFVTDDVIVP